MDIGAMSHYLTLQRPIGRSGDGYEDMATAWGAIRMAGSAEALRYGVPTATATWVITLWYRTDVRAEWRVFEPETGLAYQISGYGDPDGTRTELQLFGSVIQ